MTVWIYLLRLIRPFFTLGEICMLPGTTGSFYQRKWRLFCAGYDGIRSGTGRLGLCVLGSALLGRPILRALDLVDHPRGDAEPHSQRFVLSGST